MRSTSRILRVQQIDERVLTIVAPPTRASAGDNWPADRASASAIGEMGVVQQQDPALVLEAAQEEACRIVAAADATALKTIEASHAEGYQSGYEAGIATAEEEMRARVASIAALAANVTVDKASFVKECEAEITSLVIDVAQKVIAKEYTLDRSIVVGLVACALDRVVGQAILRIRVNPEDFDLVHQYWTERSGAEAGQSPAEVIADKRVKAGGCIVDTQGGTIDAQIDTQLDEIKRAFDVVTELM